MIHLSSSLSSPYNPASLRVLIHKELVAGNSDFGSMGGLPINRRTELGSFNWERLLWASQLFLKEHHVQKNCAHATLVCFSQCFLKHLSYGFCSWPTIHFLYIWRVTH